MRVRRFLVQHLKKCFYPPFTSIIFTIQIHTICSQIRILNNSTNWIYMLTLCMANFNHIRWWNLKKNSRLPFATVICTLNHILNKRKKYAKRERQEGNYGKVVQQGIIVKLISDRGKKNSDPGRLSSKLF